MNFPSYIKLSLMYLLARQSSFSKNIFNFSSSKEIVSGISNYYLINRSILDYISAIGFNA